MPCCNLVTTECRACLWCPSLRNKPIVSYHDIIMIAGYYPLQDYIRKKDVQRKYPVTQNAQPARIGTASNKVCSIDHSIETEDRLLLCGVHVSQLHACTYLLQDWRPRRPGLPPVFTVLRTILRALVIVCCDLALLARLRVLVPHVGRPSFLRTMALS